MRTITAKFLGIVVAFALAFLGVVVYTTWTATRSHIEELTKEEGRLALEFNLAIRDYVANTIRPRIGDRLDKDEFVPEIMSSSFVSRQIFDRIQEQYPDHLLKFSAEEPRNPRNQAGPEEVRMIRYFQEHPEEERWQGRLVVNGKEYMAYLSPMRMKQECMSCHGRPEDAPKQLVARYGSKLGFHRHMGEVVALDMVGVPLDTVNAAVASEACIHLAVAGLLLAILVAAVALAFRYVVAQRLIALTAHFRQAAAQAETVPVSPALIGGQDEIGVLAESFNILADRLRALHASLEERVAERTAALQNEVGERRRAELDLHREQRSLRKLLDVYERHRALVAYEIHDGVIQNLIGAQMTMEGSLSSLPPEINGGVRSGMKSAIDLLRGSVTEARRVMTGLRPTILDEMGIVAALDSLIAENRRPEGPAIDYTCDVHFERLAAPLETALYRIVQEGLTNALRHSGSPRIRVAVLQDRERLHVEIQDWGDGFDPNKDESGRLGVLGLRKRAQVFGGTTTIDASPGEGTWIVVELPVIEAEKGQ